MKRRMGRSVLEKRLSKRFFDVFDYGYIPCFHKPYIFLDSVTETGMDASLNESIRISIVLADNEDGAAGKPRSDQFLEGELVTVVENAEFCCT